jgi:uncharacterized membrane protein
MQDFILFTSVFLASIVEGVEALTIVLAIGMTRGWRSTRYGVWAAIVTLMLIVVALGPSLTSIPINGLRVVVGGLLLIFGLQWIRKAILRASGFIPLHDETAIFEKTAMKARNTKSLKRGAIDDWYAFTVAFKGVLLEGLEIAFIVVTFGANQHSVSLAALSAVIAVLVVTAIGVKIRKPLSQVPENTLKFIVGIMLTSFGIFWGSEGVGIRWPGSDAALLGVITFVAITSVVQVRWLKRYAVPQVGKVQ